MAIRKEKIKEQFNQVLPSVLEPGEQVQAGVFGQTGPSPWLQGGIGLLIMLAMGAKWYYLAVTDRRVIWYRGSMWTQRPKALAWADPRGSVSIREVVADATVWNKMRYRKPDGTELRFNVHRFWRDEFQALVALLPGAAVPPPPAP